MSEAQETTETPETTELTMDQILSEPNVPTNPEPTTETVTQPTQQTVDVSGLVEKLNKVDEIIEHFQTESVTKDINSAVSKISELSGVNNEKQCKFMLQEMYDSDPSFKKIFDSRSQNPAALNQALDLVAKEAAKEFGNIVDPNLAETQSALLDANLRSTTGGGETPDPFKEQEKSLMDLSDDDFNKAMGKILQG